MIEEVQQVDESVLTPLIGLRGERDALRQRLARMQEASSEVSEAVLARVRSDYQARIAALEEEAQPLEEEARAAYGRLKPMIEQAQEKRDALRLDQEEIELRHRLGEFDDAEHEKRTAEVDESFRAAESRCTELSAAAARFASAFDSLDDLAPAGTCEAVPPASAAPQEPAAVPAASAPLGAEHEDDGTLMLPPEPPPAPEPPPLPTSPEPPVWTPSKAWSAAQPAPAAFEELWRSASEAPATDAASTPVEPVALEREAPTSGMQAVTEAPPRARLEALDSDLEAQPHLLEPLTFIGRTPENQIRIYKPAVSRRHAQITETEAGWLLRDLSSENGTYVNGQRITERLLADGDRVQFGTSRFLVHLPG